MTSGPQKKINIVLVRTTYAGNIGSSLRALANMGGHRLILVDPQCRFDDEVSRQNAAGAQEWFQKIVEYPNWEEFFKAEPFGIRIALSRRSGKNRPSDQLDHVIKKIQSDAPPEFTQQDIYLLFGPEASGLSSEDTGFCHELACLPVFGSFKSLNLAQAVMLGLFITQQTILNSQNHTEVLAPQSESLTEVQSSQNARQFFPDESIKKWLVAMGFSLEKRKRSAYLTLRRLLLQNWPTEQELLVLQAILEQNIRKLEAKHKKSDPK